ncbi:MAG: pyridoxamine 5'-phosphate oxidase family protein [Actinomycetia bacterium]|nr:pyridoxamine 5'-phosphate oxidase family protein [Actinomycetes bacterium]MCP3909768.1 pyridoxamine 5'-phosphate oxidase family protein [Actinomycetes bacterium]MCP4084010.1 pyridoxamine 5'-phosphate oxidase family protein [Actinomycetes bacterium]
MSLPVDLDRLAAEIGNRGPSAFLMTGGDAGPPRISHVSVEMSADGSMTCPIGVRAAAQIGDRPDVSLLWPAGDPTDYNLIVDAEAVLEAETATITPAFAVLHRNATADTDCGSDCVPLASETP